MTETEETVRARDLSNRLRGRYAKGPIMANGEPEFGYAVFTEMPDGRPFPGLYSEAADMIDTLAALSRAPEVEDPRKHPSRAAIEAAVIKSPVLREFGLSYRQAIASDVATDVIVDALGATPSTGGSAFPASAGSGEAEIDASAGLQ